MSKKDDKNLRSIMAQIMTVILILLFIAVGLLAYIATRPQHYAPVKMDQNVRVQVTCPGNGGGDWAPIVNGKG